MKIHLDGITVILSSPPQDIDNMISVTVGTLCSIFGHADGHRLAQLSTLEDSAALWAWVTQGETPEA